MNEEQVTAILAAAAAAFEKAEVPDGLRDAAFAGALQLLAGQQPVDTPEGPRAAGGGSPVAHGSGSEVLDAIASGLELDARELRNLYADKNGSPELIVKASKLPRTKSAASHDIALLVMAARQLGGIDEYTEAKVLRDAAKRYGKFDQSNFGHHMRSLDNLIITQGTGGSAKRKLTQPGIERAAALARGYLGDE
jgi:hypothetical protein